MPVAVTRRPNRVVRHFLKRLSEALDTIVGFQATRHVIEDRQQELDRLRALGYTESR